MDGRTARVASCSFQGRVCGIPLQTGPSFRWSAEQIGQRCAAGAGGARRKNMDEWLGALGEGQTGAGEVAQNGESAAGRPTIQRIWLEKKAAKAARLSYCVDHLEVAGGGHQVEAGQSGEGQNEKVPAPGAEKPSYMPSRKPIPTQSAASRPGARASTRLTSRKSRLASRKTATTGRRPPERSGYRSDKVRFSAVPSQEPGSQKGGEQHWRGGPCRGGRKQGGQRRAEHGGAFVGGCGHVGGLPGGSDMRAGGDESPPPTTASIRPARKSRGRQRAGFAVRLP